MSALTGIRTQARALLPGDCFLRRDQQLRALFVTDFPRRHKEAAFSVRQNLEENGFCVTEEKGLWLLDLSRERQIAFIQAQTAVLLPAATDEDLPFVSLCRRLLAQGNVAAALQPWDTVRRALLRLDAEEADLLSKELSDICALSKRKKTPLAAAVVSLLLHHKEEHA